MVSIVWSRSHITIIQFRIYFFFTTNRPSKGRPQGITPNSKRKSQLKIKFQVKNGPKARFLVKNFLLLRGWGLVWSRSTIPLFFLETSHPPRPRRWGGGRWSPLGVWIPSLGFFNPPLTVGSDGAFCPAHNPRQPSPSKQMIIVLIIFHGHGHDDYHHHHHDIRHSWWEHDRRRQRVWGDANTCPHAALCNPLLILSSWSSFSSSFYTPLIIMIIIIINSTWIQTWHLFVLTMVLKKLDRTFQKDVNDIDGERPRV